MPRKAATADQVDRAALLSFLRERRHTVLTTFRRDGRPQQSPVTYGVDTADRIVVATYPERAKTHSLRRDPRVSCCVLSESIGGPYVQVDGRAEILDLPAALEPLVEYFRVISGEHPDWAEYRRAMQEQGKCLIRI